MVSPIKQMKSSFGSFRMMFYSPRHMRLLYCACVSCRQFMPLGYIVLPFITDIPC